MAANIIAFEWLAPSEAQQPSKSVRRSPATRTVNGSKRSDWVLQQCFVILIGAPRDPIIRRQRPRAGNTLLLFPASSVLSEWPVLPVPMAISTAMISPGNVWTLARLPESISRMVLPAGTADHQQGVRRASSTASCLRWAGNRASRATRG